jgi:hypothetical protein
MHRLAIGSLALSLALAAGAADNTAGVAELLRSARLWNGLDRPDAARRQLQKVLALQADQPQALLLLGEIELRSNRPVDAQRHLALLQQRHPGDPATRELAELTRLYTRDKAQLTQLRLLRRGGNTEQALALARTLFGDALPPGDLAEEFAPLLASTPAGYERMRRGLAERIARGGSPRDRLAFYDLLAQRSATVPQAVQGYAELAAGHDIAPQRLLRPWRRALEQLPEGPAARRERERFLAQYPQDETVLKLAAGPRRPAAVAAAPRAPRVARAARPEAATAPAAAVPDAGALRAAADAELAQGHRSAAMRLLEDAVAAVPDDPWLRHDLARLYGRLGLPDLAADVMAEGRARRPHDAEMRYASALVAAAIDRDDDALALLDAVPPAQRSDGMRELAQRLQRQRSQAQARAAEPASPPRIVAAAERRRPVDEAAWFPYQRQSHAGTSTLRGNELIGVHRWPSRHDGEGFVQVDAVRLNAGRLPAAVADAEPFGTVVRDLPRDLPQHATGLSAGIGWRGDNRRFDIGVIGVGFAVPNLVGGWRESGSWRGNDVSLELSRRVLTSSLLAYAGTTDPATGAVWGGVTNTGLSLRLGRDFAGGWSAATSLRAGVLDGRNVKTNNVVQSRTTIDRDWLQRPDFTLNAGLVLSLWHYDNNQGFYSFGHGSYYSPQAYASLGVPVEIKGRRGSWSYDLRGGLSRSLSYEASAPFYPTRPGLQAGGCSAALTPFCSNGQPVYAGGGHGGGLGRSLRGDVEYRVDPHWAIGASFNIDRSAYYAPTQALIYLRRSLSPQTGTVGVPPRPIVPYSQY